MPHMVARSRQLAIEAERRFAPRLVVAVPSTGFGERLERMRAWLDDTYGSDGREIAPDRDARRLRIAPAEEADNRNAWKSSRQRLLHGPIVRPRGQHVIDDPDSSGRRVNEAFIDRVNVAQIAERRPVRALVGGVGGNLLCDQFPDVDRVWLHPIDPTADRRDPIVVEGVLTIFRWRDRHQGRIAEPIIVVERPREVPGAFVDRRSLIVIFGSAAPIDGVGPLMAAIRT